MVHGMAESVACSEKKVCDEVFPDNWEFTTGISCQKPSSTAWCHFLLFLKGSAPITLVSWLCILNGLHINHTTLGEVTLIWQVFCS